MVFMYLLYINSKTTQSNNWIGYCHRLPNVHLCVVTCTGINKYKAGKTTFIEFLCLGWEKKLFLQPIFHLFTPLKTADVPNSEESQDFSHFMHLHIPPINH